MEQQSHRACEWTKSKQKKSPHIQIYYALYCSIYPTNNAIVSLKEGFTVWRQSQKEDIDILSIIYY